MTISNKFESIKTPASIHAFYRLQMLLTIASGLEAEISHEPSSRKAVSLALISHAISNTEQELSELSDSDSKASPDPWSYDCSIINSPKETADTCAEAQPETIDYEQLVALAKNHLRLNPFAEKADIEKFVYSELCDMPRPVLVGNDEVEKAIAEVFQMRVAWAGSVLSDINAKVTSLADKILESHKFNSRKSFASSLSKALSEQSFNLSDDQIDDVISAAYIRRLPPELRQPMIDGLEHKKKRNCQLKKVGGRKGW
jgi:hypothetical protein